MLERRPASRPARREDAGAAGQVVAPMHTSEKPASRASAAAASRQVSCSSKAKAPPGLSARAHQGRRRRNTSRPSWPAVERKRGLEVGHLARDLGHHGRGNVGRIGHHQVERAQKHRVDALPQIARHHVHAAGEPQRRHVLAGQRHGFGSQVGGHHVRERMLVGDGAGDAARARAQVGHQQAFALGRPSLQKIFRLRAFGAALGTAVRDSGSPPETAVRRLADASPGTTAQAVFGVAAAVLSPVWAAASSASASASVMRESVARGRQAGGSRASASLTSTSVSGRGMSTPGRTLTAMWRKAHLAR